MAQSRTILHYILKDILGSDNCYYDPPASIQMKYPCIVYSISGGKTQHADDIRYVNLKRYTITIIDEYPDTELTDKLFFDLRLRYLSEDRQYVVNGLHHFVYTLYF